MADVVVTQEDTLRAERFLSPSDGDFQELCKLLADHRAQARKQALEEAAAIPCIWVDKLKAEIEAIEPKNRIGLPIFEKERTIHKLALVEQFIRAIGDKE